MTSTSTYNWPESRRSKSLSYSPSISDDSCVITSTTPSTPLPYSGIPFSWEQFPGIPKKNIHKKTDYSQNLLPLPPSGGNSGHSSRNLFSPAGKKYSRSQSFKKDPFFAAFVECSKDTDLTTGDFSRSSKFPAGERSGFVVSMYASCKRTCAVSESIVYRRRSSTDYF